MRRELAKKAVNEYGISLSETARQPGVTANAVSYMLNQGNEFLKGAAADDNLWEQNSVPEVASLEINTRRSLRQLRKELLNVHEAHIRDEQTGEVHVMQMDTNEFAGSVLGKLLGSELSH